MSTVARQSLNHNRTFGIRSLLGITTYAAATIAILLQCPLEFLFPAFLALATTSTVLVAIATACRKLPLRLAVLLILLNGTCLFALAGYRFISSFTIALPSSDPAEIGVMVTGRLRVNGRVPRGTTEIPALVVLDSLDHPGAAYSDLYGSDGRFEFVDIEPGKYLLWAAEDGIAPADPNMDKGIEVTIDEKYLGKVQSLGSLDWKP